MKILKWLLFPFALLYGLAVFIRNKCYDLKIFNVYNPPVPTIGVGNLSVGGTGKSPMIEYLIKLYYQSHNVAVLSRGYKRKTKGCIEVMPNMYATEVGDEPLQFKRKFKDIKVFVESNRREGIKHILKSYPKTDLILLDDAFQHRKVKAHTYVLLTTFQNPYFKDWLLPFGWLRESRRGAKRADIIVVTKCPNSIGNDIKQNYRHRINIQKDQKLVFSSIVYSKTIYSTKNKMSLVDLDNFYLITGIANPSPMVEFLSQQNKTFKHLAFPDHHNFSPQELKKIKALERPILTTEKDYMRLHNTISNQLYYMPIEVEIDEDLEFLF